ncbi:MAG: T9SS type A sorting domain-containing protein, partial [Chitinophagales bacterium]|nr:T9SS type A sorting domain-containing protein [Chitinophagales bacterium]
NTFNPSNAGVGEHEVTYTYTDVNGCTNDSSFYITVVICTGENEISNHTLIYPNPSRGIIDLSFSEPITSILNISDASGRIFRQLNLSGNSTFKLDLSDFPCGIYFLHTSEKHFKEKIVIVR